MEHRPARAQRDRHCLTGCGIGEILGMVIGTALGWGDWETIALAVAHAFFGYALTMLPLRRSGLALSAAVPLAPASDAVSIAVRRSSTTPSSRSSWARWTRALRPSCSAPASRLRAVAFVAAYPVYRRLIGGGGGTRSCTRTTGTTAAAVGTARR